MTINWERARAMRDEVAKWPAWKRQAARSAFQQPKEKQVSTELEGAALFDAAWKAIGNNDPCSIDWDNGTRWLLVPAMLEWLGTKGDVTMRAWKDGGRYAQVDFDDGSFNHANADDLPTALARLVLRVAELEGKS